MHPAHVRAMPPAPSPRPLSICVGCCLFCSYVRLALFALTSLSAPSLMFHTARVSITHKLNALSNFESRILGTNHSGWPGS